MTERSQEWFEFGERQVRPVPYDQVRLTAHRGTSLPSSLLQTQVGPQPDHQRTLWMATQNHAWNGSSHSQSMSRIDGKPGFPEVEIHLRAIRMHDHRKSELPQMAELVDRTLHHLGHGQDVLPGQQLGEQTLVEGAHHRQAATQRR